MRVKLTIVKSGKALHEGIYDLDDKTSFGAACAEAWTGIRERCAAEASSIGELMETMNESVIDELDGAEIKLTKL